MSMIGKTLGHYQITSELGKGGMGEVYQAKDRKLGRDVAIKVLPEEFARDADRVARFQREAKLLASLNHPNIAAIHGLEESGGTNFLVLELVEGQTLADRIKAGPIPVEESLKLALQIAEALEAAHEKGVIHRDLKPANIKVTPESKVKVLDFGLAKAYTAEQHELNLSNSPTLSNLATQQGVILGTAAYMPPEQAKGKAVDKRADIWAFGVVLFEVLTGRQLFTGETVSETLASVLKSEPEWKRLPPNLHPRIHLLLQRCLKKETKDRYSGISDARVDIQEVLAGSGGALAQPVAGVHQKRLRTALLWIAAIILTAIMAGVVAWNAKPAPESREVVRFNYDLSGYSPTISADLQYTIAVSPNGRQFVYSTRNGLYLRSMSDLDGRHITGTSGGGSSPFFSPDGKWVGYQSEGQLKKIPISGGAPIVLCNSGLVFGATWSTDSTIVYSDSTRGVMRVSANGGTPETLVKEGMCVSPQLMPDGKSLLFTRAIPQEVVLQSLESGERKVLLNGTMARYIPGGYLVYLSRNNSVYNAFTIPFNLETREVTGSPVSIAGDILEVAVSNRGTLIFMSGGPGTATAGRTLVWVDRTTGKEEPIAAPSNEYHYPRISPDGTKVAFAIGGLSNADIWTWDLERKNLMRLTSNEGPDLVPVWTRDGKKITFASVRESIMGLYWQAADGTGEAEKIFAEPSRIVMPYSWSPDTKTLVMTEMLDTNNFDAVVLSMDGDRKPKPLLREKYGKYQPQLSPDGRWMAYSSSETGRSEVYVRPFPNVNDGRWQVSTESGNSPIWAPNGKELFFLIGNASGVMSVSVETSTTFKPGKPKILFASSYVGFWPSDGTPWDIHPDGTKFLMMKQSSVTSEHSNAPRAPKITVVLNWFEELKQRVPMK
jgi:eukaryotic-like serine/threonine-protein kinase